MTTVPLAFGGAVEERSTACDWGLQFSGSTTALTHGAGVCNVSAEVKCPSLEVWSGAVCALSPSVQTHVYETNISLLRSDRCPSLQLTEFLSGSPTPNAFVLPDFCVPGMWVTTTGFRCAWDVGDHDWISVCLGCG